MTRRTRRSRLIASARLLAGPRRNARSDQALALYLAGIAGAANAGGFFALGQYTSHMTGYLSQLADHLVIGDPGIVAVAMLAIAAFTAGAVSCTVLVHWARQRMGRQQYALPLAVQGVCLGCFAFGGVFTTAPGRLFALACLCFIMGMQNATITKISGARIRTTHATGMITDIGIECGRALFHRLRPRGGVAADTARLRLLLALVGTYGAGGIVGALGYGLVGFHFSWPLALLLMALSLPALLHKAPRRGHGASRPTRPQGPAP